MIEYVLASSYASKADCIAKFLKAAKVTNRETLQNLPKMGHFCGVDVYQFVAEINQIIDAWDIIQTIASFSEEEE